jgi:hypothetical protein
MALTEQRKTCSKCGVEKALSDFYKRKRSPDGHEAECKECRKQRNSKWFVENKDRHREMTRSWYENNREYHLQKTKERYEADKPAALAKYYKRDARTRMATPRWADLKKIALYYRIAAQQTKETGVKWEIDHIVPLQSDRVCGLHVEHNLSFTRADYNRRKSNRYWPDMPEGEPTWL